MLGKQCFMDSVMLPSDDAGRLVNQTICGRYLTNAQKRIELIEFERRRIPDWDGLVSLPDRSMIQYLTELNSIPGLCTLQSCSGHIKEDARDRSEYITNGSLWIWLSQEMMQRFYVAAFELRQRSGIEKLTIQFQRHGREFVDIQFAGDGHGKLENSMSGIVEFFTKLEAKRVGRMV